MLEIYSINLILGPSQLTDYLGSDSKWIVSSHFYCIIRLSAY